MVETSPGPGDVLVDVRDLTKHYGAIRAVDGITFQVRRGDVLGFLGPNGAGKTTAMKMITGFLEPDAGGVRVAGHEVAGESLEVRRKVGYLPENAPAYSEMTVRGFLDFIADARALADRRAAVARVVDRTGLSRVLGQSIETLSKGFKRRVGLAQALIHDPEVLILDEPTDGLDPNQKVLVQELITELAAEKAIILSTHILDEAERVCSRAVIISRGKIVADSTPEELMRRAPDHNAVRLRFAGEPPPEVVERIEALPWCRCVERLSSTTLDVFPKDREDHMTELLAGVDGAGVEEAHLLTGSLNDLFRDVTEGVAS